jgi:hypothetical protein
VTDRLAELAWAVSREVARLLALQVNALARLAAVALQAARLPR